MRINNYLLTNLTNCMTKVFHTSRRRNCLFIRISLTIGLPYTLKVSNNLIKDIFLFSDSKYISVLLYSILLLAIFTQTQRLFSAQIKYTVLPVCLCPDIHDEAICVSQVPVVFVLLYHDRNRVLHLFQQ